MMHNHRGQIVHIGGGRRASRLRSVVEHKLRHVHRGDGERDAQVDFGAKEIVPAKAFDVQTQHVRQASDPKAFRRLLLALAAAAVIQFGFGQFLNLKCN